MRNALLVVALSAVVNVACTSAPTTADEAAATAGTTPGDAQTTGQPGVRGDGATAPSKPEEKAPTADDGARNGDESDVDCGGTVTGAPRCDVGRSCRSHADCASDACAWNGTCVAVKSCTQHMGGDTCGVGEVGDPSAKHESCCSTAPLPYSATRIDKYLVTAGRMRAMIDRLGGNVRGFVATLPASQWSPAWNGLVPGNRAEAEEMLGPYWAGAPNDANGNESKRSCSAGNYTGRTWWAPPTNGDYSDFTKDQLDAKALNCVGWHLMTAFCAWDGGRMGSRAELALAYTNGGSTRYPWQWKDTSSYDPNAWDGRLNHVFSYNFPDVPGMRRSGSGDALDIAYHVSPPGRFPSGWNKDGVEIAGNLLTWITDAEYFITWNHSWERHGDNDLQAQSWLVTGPGEPNGYYAIGGRCLRD